MGNICFSICKRRKNFIIEGLNEKDCEDNLKNKLEILYPKNKINISGKDVLIDGNRKYDIDKLKKLDNENIVFKVGYLDYDNY